MRFVVISAGVLVLAIAGCGQTGDANTCPSEAPLACAGTAVCCPTTTPIHCGDKCWSGVPTQAECNGVITVCNAPTDSSPCQSGSYCYEWVCSGDAECVATNPNSTNYGANDEGNDVSCAGLLTFGQHFWNIPPAWQACTLIP